MVKPSAEGATEQATGQTPKSTKKTQQAAQSTPRKTKNDVFDSAEQAQTNDGDEDEEEEEEEEDEDQGKQYDDDEDEEQSAVEGATEDGKVQDTANGAAEGVKGAAEGVTGKAGDAVGGATEAVGGAVDQAKDTAEGAAEGAAGGDDQEQEVLPIGTVAKDGSVKQDDGSVVGSVAGNVKGLVGGLVDEEGDVMDQAGNILGQAQPNVEGAVEGAGDAVGDVAGKAGEAAGDAVDKVGDTAKKAGDAAGIQLPSLGLPGPLDFQEGGNIADAAGNKLGKLTQGDPTELAKQTISDINEKGEILGENGNVLGKVDFDDLDKLKKEAEEKKKQEIPSPEVLEGKKVNKSGKIVDENGGVWGELVEGEAKKLAGRTVDSKGQIWDDRGKVVGRAQAYPEDDRQVGGEAPFENFPDNKVQRNGEVHANGEVVGKVVEGDLKECEGKTVDPDGDINDKNGNTIGRAERTEDAEPEPEVDQSILAGKRVNKNGNVVDERGSLFGKVVEGDVSKLVGKMCDKQGQIWSENGEVIGRAEILPESQREIKKDGPFANYEGCKVRKDGLVYSSDGEVIGKLIEGDPKQLAGHVVDADGDVIDSTGNSIGKAERYEEPEVEKKHHPCAGYKVNAEGNVIDDNGDIIGKLIEGDIGDCRGIEIDDDGDIVNQKDQKVGHVARIQDVKPEKTQEEIDAEKDAENDKKLTKQITYHVDEALNKINPILKDITSKIDAAENTPKEELDEEQLVKEVKPLIEEGGKILENVNKEIRACDPDGRLQTQAKTKAAAREASPEEARLAEMLKELTGNVQNTIDGAKRKLAGMPHAKDKLNPLWALLNEPLFQILAAVGLLLNGVLSLVGKLLGGLGLGGIVDKLLGGLGLDKILKGFGIGGKK